MNTKPIVLFFFSAFLFACNSNQGNSHFSREKMSEVLVDIHYAEVYCTMVNDSLRQITNKNNDSLVVYYGDVLKHHNVTPDEFRQSMDWYEKHPGELEHVYVKVLEIVTKAEGVTQANSNK